MILLIKTVFGPELYRIFKYAGQNGKTYQMNNIELYSNSLISFFHGFCVFCKWTSPVLLAYAYSRGYFTNEGLFSLFRFAIFFGGFLITAYITRAFGRFKNPDYQIFIEKYSKLNKNNKDLLSERREFLSQYDFEILGWKSDFVASSKPPKFTHNHEHRFFHSSIIDSLKFNTWCFLSCMCVNTFGLRMMYPGILLKNLIGNALLEGRSKFIETKRAKRAILQTTDNYSNKIDTLFVDQRNVIRHNSRRNFATIDQFDSNNNSSFEQNGNTLVICCDGNASFYEVGCFQIPIEKGFSTLGWNYPGFGQSTGLPYPDQLTSACDAVMQYAFHLGFKPENIVLFSWSIGGFAVSWISSQYPDIKAVVLDACFDSIIPLAQQQMPKFATVFVDYAIKHNLNLNVAEIIGKYNGPVLFIRRTQDEIISTIPRIAAANRGNDLLIKTLEIRYPNIVNNDTVPYIRTWLSAKSEFDRARIFSSYSSDIEKCENILSEYVQFKPNYPFDLGKEDSNNGNQNDAFYISRDLKLAMSLYLAEKYLLNFEAAHCTQLPTEYFKLPWSEKQLVLKRKPF